MKRGALLISRRGTSFCFSRDDDGKCLKDYHGRKIYESDPIARLAAVQTATNDKQ